MRETQSEQELPGPAPGPEGDPSLAVVVINWNGLDDSLACLAALRGSIGVRLDVIVVDNGSDGDEGERIRAAFPEVTLLALDENLGFAEGSNQGAALAWRRGASHVLLLNNDAVVAPETIASLMETARSHPDAAVIAPKIFLAETPERLESAGMRLSLGGARFAHVGFGRRDDIPRGAPLLRDAVSGCAMLVRRETFQALAGFDPRFFCYLEDLDLCLRARKAGQRVLLDPGAAVLHRGGGSLRRSGDLDLRFYYLTRNHLLLMQKHRSGAGRLLRRVQAPVAIALAIGFALVRSPGRRLPRLRQILRGARDYRRGRFHAGGPVPGPGLDDSARTAGA